MEVKKVVNSSYLRKGGNVGRFGRVREWGRCKRYVCNMDFSIVGIEKVERCMGVSSFRKVMCVNLGIWYLIS